MGHIRQLRIGLLVTFLVMLPFIASCASAPTPTPAPTKAPPAPTKMTEPTKAPAAATKPTESAKAAPVPTKPAEVARPAPATVKLGIDSAGRASDAGYFIALEKGYFKEQNLNIDAIPIAQSPEMIQLLATRELEVAGGGSAPGLFNAIQRGIPLKIVADKGSHRPGMGYMGLVVRKDLWEQGAIKNPADLKGKNFGVPSTAGSIVDIWLDTFLSKVGLSWRDVNATAITFADTNAAFASKAIDAAFAMEPLLTIGVQQGLYVRWKGVDEIIPNHQGGALIYSAQFAKERTEVGKRFMVAYVKALRDYSDAFVKKDAKARDEIIPILIKHTSLKDRALYDKAVFPGFNPDGYVNAESTAGDQDWFVANGFLKQQADLKGVIDNQFADYAVQVLGKYSK